MRWINLIPCLTFTACSYGHPLMGVFPSDKGGAGADDSALALLSLFGAGSVADVGSAGMNSGSLEIQASATQVLIYESVTFSVSGGTPPYSFRVSTGGGTISTTGLYTAAAVLGTNTITVVDSAGLTGSTSVVVSGGTGNGTFSVSNNYGTASGPHAVRAGDITNDGVLDLVVGTQTGGSNQISIYEGIGDGSFLAGTTNNAGGGVRTVVVADFDADGNLDVGAGTTGNLFSIFLGNADITFQPGVDYAHAPQPLGIKTGDMDNDGILDIVSGDLGTNTISFFKGNGDGTFQSASTFGSLNTPRRVALADFNNDGNLDIVAGNRAGTPSLNPGATVYLGNGDGTFQNGVEYASTTDSRAALTGDFNGDANIDIVTLPNSGTDITIFLGNGDGTFQAGQTFTVSGTNVSRAGVACDFNGDAQMDLALTDRANNDIVVLFGDGTGSFTTGPSLNAPGDPHAVDCRDLTGDGKMDVSMTSFTADSLRVFVGN